MVHTSDQSMNDRIEWIVHENELKLKQAKNQEEVDFYSARIMGMKVIIIIINGYNI